MTKPFKSLDSLLRLMRNRNIAIAKGSEGSKVKSILARENYYSVINGYKDIFLDTNMSKSSGNDYYVTGTTFFHIYGLYCFDRNLRSILMKAILQAEQNLRTKVSYRFSEEYTHEFSHLNINNFSKANLTQTTKLIAKLSSVTQRNAADKTSGFYHYLTKHQDLPLWVLVTKLTLGEITSFYKSIAPTLQEKILIDIHQEYCKEFNCSISQPASTLISDFQNILDVFVEFRNICAHGDRLYNYRSIQYIKTNTGARRSNRHLTHYFISPTKGSEASVYGILISLRLFLPRMEYKRLIKDVIAELRLINQELPIQQFNMLLNKLELTLSWKQTLENLK